MKVNLRNLGTTVIGGGLGALLGQQDQVVPEEPFSPLKSLSTGQASKEFESPLALFQKTITENLGLKTEEPPQKPEGDMNYFSYGQPTEVESVLGLEEETPLEVASGGLIAPLMKSGGLPMVHYAGKPRIDFRKGAYVQGPGDGQSDDIPAMLADGEYVFDSETVAALGNGSNRAGAELLDKMREHIRQHKRSGSVKKIPPPSKSPLEYLAMAKRSK